MLSIDEFTELCCKLFVGTENEFNGGIYNFDPEAIFKWLTADALAESGIEKDTSTTTGSSHRPLGSSAIFEISCSPTGL